MLGHYTYTLSTLTPGEEIVLVGRLHYFALIIPFTLTALTFILGFAGLMVTFGENYSAFGIFGVVFVWLCFLAMLICTITSWFKRNLIEFVCTNKRVVKRTGIINVTTEELNRERIESVEIRQSIFGRLFNYGDILFSGTGTSKIVFHFLNQPKLMKQIIDSVISTPKSDDNPG